MNNQYYPAAARFPNMHLSSDGDRARTWIGIARRLARHETFKKSYFVRVDAPVLYSRQRPIFFDQAGRLTLRDGQSVRLPVSFYSEEYLGQNETVLACETDGNYVRVSSADTYDVALRYDSLEFWLRPSTESFDALGRVTITMTSNRSVDAEENIVAQTTSVDFPVAVRRSRSRLAVRVAASAVGAFLVALPAILGQHTPLQLRIIVAILGALLLAFATIVIAREGR